MKQAVCVLIPRGREFLSICRRGDNTKWGIPGGKVDPGETNVQAAVREIKEETNIDLDAEHLIPIYSGACYGDVNFWVTTYLYRGEILPDQIKAEEGFEIDVKHMLLLCDHDVSPFANYNTEVFAALTSLEVGRLS